MSLSSISNGKENGLAKVQERQLRRDYHDHFTNLNGPYILYTQDFHALLWSHLFTPRSMGKNYSATFMRLLHDDS